MHTASRRFCFVLSGGLLSGGVLAAGLSCGGDSLVLPGDGVAANIIIVSGDNQMGTIGAALPAPLMVQVSDTKGRPVGNQRVTFGVVTSNGGEVAPTEARTDANGQANTQWMLGTAAGQQQVRAQAVGDGAADNLAVLFSAATTAAAAANLELVSGNGQTATAASTVPAPIVVRATDRARNPVADVPVQWTADNGGSVSTGTMPTGPDGLSSVSWTLGPGAGEQTATATVEGLTGSPVRFTATASIGSAGQLTVTTQPSSTASSGVAFGQPPQVQLRDAAGNAVPQPGVAIFVAISVAPQGAAPSLIGSPIAATDANGLATFNGVGISGPGGSYTLNFTGVNLSGVNSQTITIRAGSPSKLAFVTQPTNVVAGARLPAVRVAVQDPQGNVVTSSSNTVALSLDNNPSGGTLGGQTSVRAVNGFATFDGLTIDRAGQGYTLRASSAALAPATSSSFNVGAAAAAQIVAVAGTGQTATAGTSVSVRPAVKVTSATGTPVSGVPIVFAVVAGGGTVSGPSQTTGPDGIATVGSWTLGPAAGTNNNGLTATAQGSGISGNPVTFTASARAGSAGRLSIVRQPPATGQSGVALAPQPQVQLLDNGGNAVRQGGVGVTATVASGPGGATLQNATATTDNAGLATFNGLAIIGPAGDYALRFSAAGVEGATSTSIQLGAGTANKLVLVQQPSATVQSGVQFPQQPVVQVQDANGNPVASPQRTIVANIDNAAGSLGGTTRVSTDANGRATFTDLRITGPAGGGRTLLFSAGGIASVESNAISVVAGAVSASRSTLVASDASVAPGEISRLTVTVRDDAGNPIGNAAVTLSATGDGNTFDPPSPTTASNGVAQANFSSSVPGDKTIRATVGGVAITQTATVTVGKRGSTTTIISDLPDPSSPGADVTVAVSVSGPGGTPSGTVQVSGGGDTCQVALSGGAGNCLLQPTSSGNIMAAYSGDASFAGSSTSAPHTVATIETTTQITSDEPEGSQSGADVTVTVVVTASGAPGPVLGSVGVTGGGSTCTVALLNGTGSCVLKPTSSGDITASYPGNAVFSASSDTEPHTVAAAETSTTVTSSDASSVFGQPVTIAGVVASGAGTPSGPVQFVVDGANAGAPRSLSVGRAELTLGTLPVGTHAIAASYGGSPTFAPSSGTLGGGQVVSPASTATVITADQPDPSSSGADVTVAVTVAVVAPGSGTPPGTVAVSGGGDTCDAPLANGTGTCVLQPTTTGNIVAAYPGSTSFSSSSASEAHAIEAANAAPIANDDAYSVTITNTLAVSAPGVLDNDDDPGGGAPLSAVLGAGPSHASSFDLNSDGSFTYTPDPLYLGTDTFTYTASDSEASSPPATVTITISAL